MGYQTKNNRLRPINIKFDIYSDSEDNEFKSELILLMRGSVLELQQAANTSYNLRSADIFKRASHKAKSTLVLLDDQEFFAIVESFKDQLQDSEDRKNQIMNSGKIDKLNELCDSIAESLQREAEKLRAA